MTGPRTVGALVPEGEGGGSGGDKEVRAMLRNIFNF